jgi:NAD(P)H-flavin reductase
MDTQPNLTLTTEFEQHFCYAAGSEIMMRKLSQHTDHKRMGGMGTAKALLKRA